MKIVNKNYNISNELNKNIVLISDIHYYDKTDLKLLNKVLSKIKQLKPDYICIPGDITDESYIKDELEFIGWLKDLSKITKVIVSIGNHEYYIDKSKDIYGLNKNLFEKISKIDNLYLLDNTNLVIDDINFIGVNLPVKQYKEKNIDSLDNYFKNLKTYKTKYNILLCHSPFNICDEDFLNKYNFNLILCGHTHGGAVPRLLRFIFKNNGLISPKKKLFPKKVYGLFKYRNTNIIITSGIRVISEIMGLRCFNNIFASEIVKIEI